MADQKSKKSGYISIVASAGIVLASGIAAFLFGLPSGALAVLAWVNLQRSRRSETGGRLLLAHAGLASAVASLGLGYWFYQWMLWDSHYHPGAGGQIAAPTTAELAIVPLVSTGIGLLIIVSSELSRRGAARRKALLPTPTRPDGRSPGEKAASTA